MANVRALITARLWRSLRRDESGQDVLEYGLLAVIIGIAGIAVVPLDRQQIEHRLREPQHGDSSRLAAVRSRRLPP